MNHGPNISVFLFQDDLDSETIFRLLLNRALLQLDAVPDVLRQGLIQINCFNLLNLVDWNDHPGILGL